MSSALPSLHQFLSAVPVWVQNPTRRITVRLVYVAVSSSRSMRLPALQTKSSPVSLILRLACSARSFPVNKRSLQRGIRTRKTLCPGMQHVRGSISFGAIRASQSPVLLHHYRVRGQRLRCKKTRKRDNSLWKSHRGRALSALSGPKSRRRRRLIVKMRTRTRKRVKNTILVVSGVSKV